MTSSSVPQVPTRWTAGPTTTSSCGATATAATSWRAAQTPPRATGSTSTARLPADDVFTLDADAGGRLDFDRVSPGPFTLDIGTAETLTINGIGGNDTFTVDFVDGDAIPSGNITFNGGDPTTTPGDRLFLAGGSQGTVTYNYTSASSGSVVTSAFGTVNFTGLEIYQ